MACSKGLHYLNTFKYCLHVKSSLLSVCLSARPDPFQNMCLVNADQPGYIVGALIGQNPFNLQTSTEARLAPGSLVQSTCVQRMVYSLHVQQYNWANQSACATSFDKKLLRCESSWEVLP